MMSVLNRARCVRWNLGASAPRATIRIVAAAVVVALASAGAEAALVAKYDFKNDNGDDISGSPNTYDLSASAFGTTAPSYPTDLNGNRYLHVTGTEGVDGKILQTGADALLANGDDGGSDWIVSFWFRTDDWSQDTNAGLISSSTDSDDAASWQLSSDSGSGEVVFNETGGAGNNTTVAWSSQPSVNEWHHLYLIKTSDSAWALYLDKALIASGSQNIGRVDEVRLGINRNTSRGMRMDIDLVEVWDTTTDPDTDVTSVFDAGAGQVLATIPAPSSLAASAVLMLTGATVQRRRRMR